MDETQRFYHSDEDPVVRKFREFSGKAGSDHSNCFGFGFKKLNDPVSGIQENFGPLAANFCAVTAGYASFINNFGLAAYNTDSFGRALPDAGVACTAKLFNGVDKHDPTFFHLYPLPNLPPRGKEQNISPIGEIRKGVL